MMCNAFSTIFDRHFPNRSFNPRSIGSNRRKIQSDQVDTARFISVILFRDRENVFFFQSISYLQVQNRDRWDDEFSIPSRWKTEASLVAPPGVSEGGLSPPKNCLSPPGIFDSWENAFQFLRTNKEFSDTPSLIHRSFYRIPCSKLEPIFALICNWSSIAN